MGRIVLMVAAFCMATVSMNAADIGELLRPSSKPDTLVVSHPAAYFTIDGMSFARHGAIPMGGRVAIAMALPGIGDVQLDLTRFRVIEPDARLVAITASGPVQIAKPESILLHGSIRGISGSHVMLACHPTYVVGYVSVDMPSGHRRYLVAPTAVPSSPVTMIVYDERFGQFPAPWSCHVNDDDVSTKPAGRGGKKEERPQAGTLRRIEMALEGDFTYYQDHGNDAVRATEYAEDVIAACSDIYERDVAGTLYIKSWELWTVNDPYPGTNSSTLLTQFRDYWRVNKGAVTRSIAHLFSGINGIGGIAYLTVLCNKNNGYAVDGLNNNIVYPRTTYAWDTDVVSHELGHNVGSPHTHSCSWAPPIDSCYAAEGGCFPGTKAVRGTIMSYCHLTPQGTNLEFHPRVQTLMETRLAEASACVPLVSDMEVSAGNDTTVCPGTSVMLRATVTGGTGPYTYAWTPTASMTGSATSTPTVTPARTTSYVCEARDAFGMLRRDTVRVIVNSQLALQHAPDVTICEGDQVQLLPVRTSCGTGTITYEWTPATGLTSTTTLTTMASPAMTTTYRCTAVHECGDTARISIIVRVNERPRVTLPPNTTICKGDVVPVSAQIIRGTPTYTLQWSIDGTIDPDATTTSLDLRPERTTTLILQATDAKGCVGLDTMLITVHPSPTATIDTVTQRCAGEAVTNVLRATGGTPPYSYRWLLGDEEIMNADSSVRFIAIQPTDLVGIVTDANGCADTVSTPIDVRSLDVAFLPDRLGVVPMEACQETMRRVVEVRNDAKDTVRIVDVRARAVEPTTTLPIVIPPGTTTGVILDIRIPELGAVSDTVRFLDAACSRVYSLPVSGTRGGVQTATSLGIDAGIGTACEAAVELRATAAIRNGGTTAVTLTELRASSTLDVSITAALPAQIAAGATIDVPITIRGAMPSGDLRDSLVAVFRTSTCNGSSVLPLRARIAPYELGVPESVEFGLAEGTQQVSRTITLQPRVEGLARLSITRVEITPPFRTDLAAGTALVNGVPLPVVVSFHAADVTRHGAQQGTLRLDIDGCASAVEIDLTASTPVSVDDDVAMRSVYVDATRHVIIVREAGMVDVRVVDVLGRTLRTAQGIDRVEVEATGSTVLFVVVRTTDREYVVPIIAR
jgi:hypothetical protein